MSEEKVIDPDWLREQYVGQGRSAQSLATEIGTTAVTVTNRLRRLGIPVRSNQAAPPDRLRLQAERLGALRVAADLRRRLSQITDETAENAVLAARAAGLSWQAIAAALEVAPDRARARYGHLEGGDER